MNGVVLDPGVLAPNNGQERARPVSFCHGDCIGVGLGVQAREMVGAVVNPQDFLILNLVVAAVIGVVFLRGLKQKRPAKLKFSSSAKNGQPLATKPGLRALEEGTEEAERESINLNVMFNYNGHSWDAYEVLGVPAGSSMAAVEKAFQASLKSSKPESEEFLRAAFDSIRSDRKRSARS